MDKENFGAVFWHPPGTVDHVENWTHNHAYKLDDWPTTLCGETVGGPLDAPDRTGLYEYNDLDAGLMCETCHAALAALDIEVPK